MRNRVASRTNCCSLLSCQSIEFTGKNSSRWRTTNRETANSKLPRHMRQGYSEHFAPPSQTTFLTILQNRLIFLWISKDEHKRLPAKSRSHHGDTDFTDKEYIDFLCLRGDLKSFAAPPSLRSVSASQSVAADTT